MHLTLGIFGSKELMKNIGKQGTVNDIMIYNHASSEGVFTFVSPNSDKVHSLLQAINMIDFPVVACEEATKELAEQIVAIEAFGFEKILAIENEELKMLVKGVENVEWIAGEKELKERMRQLNSRALTDQTWLPVDNYFNVKSVGTVVLSVMKGGSIRKYEKLFVYPTKKEVVVKGIQSQDREIEEAHSGMRVGLNLKGAESDEMKRGYVLSGSAEVSKNLRIEFTKSKYSKENVETGSRVLLSIGLQVIAAKAEEAGGDVLLSLEQPAAYLKGQKCLIASTKSTMPRIIGAGIVL